MANATAKFDADFTEFDKGVQQATGKLLDFEKATTKAGKAGDEFGYKLVKASESAAFLKQQGLDDQLRQVDGILGTLGISTGGFIKVLSDLGSVAGKTITSLGPLGVAGAILATGTAAYKSTRFLLEYTGVAKTLDPAIQSLWERVLGFKSGTEEAAAAQDVINRAIANGADASITYGEAIEFNRKAAEQQSATFRQAVNPAREMHNQMAAWQKEIRDVNKRGDLLALNEAIDKGAFSLQKLATMFGVSVEALEDYKRRREETFRAEDQLAQASAAANARALQEAEKRAKADAEFAEAKWKQQLKLDEDLRASNEKLTQARLAQVNEGVLKELAAYQQLNPVIAEQDTIYTRLATGQQQLSIAKAQGLPTLQQETLLHQQFGQALMDEAIQEEKLRWKIEETTGARQADNQAYLDGVAQRKAAAQESLTFTPLTQGAGSTTSEGVTGRLARMNEFYGASTDPITAAYRAAGIFTGYNPATTGYRQPVTVNVQGNVLGTQQEIARLVGDALGGNYRAGGNRAPI